MSSWFNWSILRETHVRLTVMAILWQFMFLYGTKNFKMVFLNFKMVFTKKKIHSITNQRAVISLLIKI